MNFPKFFAMGKSKFATRALSLWRGKGNFFKTLPQQTPWSILRDVAAGVQLAAMNIPQVLGYTKIAGTPVVTGFYTLLFPLIAFAAFGSSRYLVVSADSATAAILAGGISLLAPLGTPHYVELAGMVALMTAFLLLIARVLKFGFLADFLSQTALVGFLIGVGFQVAIAVLGGMMGLEVTSPRTVVQLEQILSQIREVHPLALEISGSVLAGIFLCQWISPKIPGSLLAVVGAIMASALWHFGDHGIAVIGPVAGGLPRFTLPHASWRECEAPLPVLWSFSRRVPRPPAFMPSVIIRNSTRMPIFWDSLLPMPQQR